MRKLLLFTAIFFALSLSSVYAGCVIPTDGMDIVENTMFCKGTYNLPHGLDVKADKIVIDCNDSTIIGGSSNFLIRVEDRNDMQIRDCNVEGAYGCFLIERSNNIHIFNNDISCWDEGMFMGHSHNNFITNNIFRNPKGIYLRASQSNFIAGNTFYNDWFTIFITGGMVYSNNTYFSLNPSYNNIIFNNSLYANFLFPSPLPFEIIDYNKFCFNGIGNNYFNGSTGPICPEITITTTTTLPVTTVPSDLEQRVSALESIVDSLKYYVNLIICQLLPKGLMKEVTCPVYE